MILLGIDGGGTKTHALALDEHGNVVGSGVGGPCNYHVIGLNRALTALADATRQALGDRKADCAAICMGSCDSPKDEARLTTGVQHLDLAEQFRCYNDTFAALRAGSRHPYGVAVICGSGFNACALCPDGRSFRLYSLGPLTGDWGGGYSLGEAALGAVYRADDGRGEPTALTGPLLRALGVPDLATLADHITEGRLAHNRVASLAPLVFEITDAGDAVAQSIIKRLADEIIVSVSAMLRRGGMESIDVDVALAGGVMHGRGSLLLDTVTAQVTARYPKAHVRRVNVPPVVGAVLLAYDALHVSPPDIEQLKLPAQTLIASLPS
jgi:N-acetylglucosamine kinase-like BadF-type ATPase